MDKQTLKRLVRRNGSQVTVRFTVNLELSDGKAFTKLARINGLNLATMARHLIKERLKEVKRVRGMRNDSTN